MATDFATLATPHLAAHVPAGETLRGVLAANHAKTFGGGLYGIGVTEWRLLLQPLDRRWQPKGPLRTVSSRAELAKASIDGAGDGWITAPSMILSSVAVTLRVRADDGDKLKLMMMQGGGKMFGGTSQRDGVEALARLLIAARS